MSDADHRCTCHIRAQEGEAGRAVWRTCSERTSSKRAAQKAGSQMLGSAASLAVTSAPFAALCALRHAVDARS